MTQQIAKLKYLHIAPRKVRLIADTLKGLSAQEAEAQLMLRPQRASKALLGLLRSAVANARNNQKLNPASLVISSLRVDQAAIIKRILPRAQGTATPLQKKMSHVVLVLAESAKASPERFKIQPPVKKEKKAKKTPLKPRVAKTKAEKPKEKVGFFKRMFMRKSV